MNRTGTAAAAAGLAAQTVQVVCLREILQAARGGEAVLGLALAAWLIGSSLGALVWRGRPRPAAWLTLLVPPALLVVLRLWPVSHGSWAPGAALVAAAAAFFPAAYLSAVLRRGAGRFVFAFEALGACVAGALLTFALLETLPALALLLLAGTACLAAGGLHPVLGAVLAAACVAAIPADARLESPRAGDLWPGSQLVRRAETPYGRLLWLRRGDQHSLFVNGQLAFTSPDRVGAEAFAAVVLAAHPDPERVLLAGPGLAGLARECLRHPVRRLDIALLDEHLVELVQDDLAPEDRAALEKVRLIYGDPRDIATRAAYDVVIVLAGDPSTLATGRFYTAEFFRALKLRDGGFVAFGLPAAPNERAGEVMARNVSVFRALAPLEAVVLPGPVDLFLAGKRAPDVSPAVLAGRLRRRGIVLRHHAQDFYSEQYAPPEVERVTAAYRRYPEPVAPAVPFLVEGVRRGAPPPAALPHRDLRPGAVLHSLAALARKEQAGTLRFATRHAGAAPWVLLPLAGLGLFWAWLRGGAARAYLSAATSGAASMGLWVVLLMAHQARVGALYADLALLAAAFMAGFALGTRVRARLMWVDLAFVVVCAAALPVLGAGGRTTYAALAALVGAAGGATLANAAALFPQAAARLYAADLAGAALAALLFGTLLLPALGATSACATTAALKLASAAGRNRFSSRSS